MCDGIGTVEVKDNHKYIAQLDMQPLTEPEFACRLAAQASLSLSRDCSLVCICCLDATALTIVARHGSAAALLPVFLQIQSVSKFFKAQRSQDVEHTTSASAFSTCTLRHLGNRLASLDKRQVISIAVRCAVPGCQGTAYNNKS